MPSAEAVTHQLVARVQPHLCLAPCQWYVKIAKIYALLACKSAIYTYLCIATLARKQVVLPLVLPSLNPLFSQILQIMRLTFPTLTPTNLCHDNKYDSQIKVDFTHHAN